MAPLLDRVRVLAAKTETTPGTAESLLAAQAAFNVFDARIQPTAEMDDRPQQASFQHLASAVGLQSGQITFEMEIYAGAAQPLWASTFLPGCGLGATGSAYALDILPPEAAGTTCKTLTVGMFENGVFKSICGAMGNAEFKFVAGKIARIAFTFLGKWVAPSDVPILAPTYPPDSPLRFQSSSLLLGSWSPVVQELTLNTGNELYLREDSSKATGLASTVITDRRVTGSFNPEATLVATNDIYGDWLAGTEAALSFGLSESGGDAATFAAGDCQHLSPQEAERSGLSVDQVGFALNDDDLTLTLVPDGDSGSGS